MCGILIVLLGWLLLISTLLLEAIFVALLEVPLLQSRGELKTQFVFRLPSIGRFGGFGGLAIAESCER